VLSALAKDDIIKNPVIAWFGVERKGEPLRALVLTGLICAVCLVIGELDFISPVITSFFLLSYMAINWACYSAETARAPSWRPSFRYFHKNAALAGAGLCLLIMLVLSPSMTAVALLLAAVLFKAFRTATESAMHAERVSDAHAHVKTFRPQLLTLVGDPMVRGSLAQLAAGLVSDRGLTLLASVVPEQDTWEESVAGLNEARAAAKKWLQDRQGQVSGFEMSVVAKSVRAGAQQLMVSGIGPFRSNTVVVGMKELPEEGVTMLESQHTPVPVAVAPPTMPQGVPMDEWVGILRDACALGQGVVSVAGTRHLYAQAASVSSSKTGVIDIYWLSDDGGLTLLLAFLLSQSPDWRGCELRVFCSALGRELTEQRLRMEALLSAFRIKAEVQVIPPSLLHQSWSSSVNAFPILKRGFENEGPSRRISTEGLAPPSAPGAESPLNSYLTSHRDATLTIDMGTAERLEGTSDHGSVFGLWKLNGGSQGDEPVTPTRMGERERERGPERQREGVSLDPRGRGREKERERDGIRAVKQSGYYLRSVSVPEDMVQQTRRFYRLGNVIRHMSSGSNTVFVTLPVPQLNIDSALYVAWCNAICDIRGVPVVLIRGSQTVLEVE
ncbi:hypothetical protein KIPB_006702, partial [Kipferlia bialata]